MMAYHACLSMKILLFGSSGNLGRAIQNTFSVNKNITLISSTREMADFTRLDTLEKTLQKANADIIINAAAYTHVDKAESEADLAYQVNATAPELIAQWCKKHSSYFIHYSTDYVFDGSKAAPYLESDKSNPLGVYGKSKALGDELIQAANPGHLILRISWAYSPERHNFFTTMMRLFESQETLKVVNDQWGAPTASHHIAQATSQVITQRAKTPIPQLLNFTNTGAATWYEFAQAIFELRQQANIPTVTKEILPISSHAYNAAAKRPENSRLNTDKFFNSINLVPRTWQQGLKDCFSLWKSQKQTEKS